MILRDVFGPNFSRGAFTSKYFEYKAHGQRPGIPDRVSGNSVWDGLYHKGQYIQKYTITVLEWG
jgi:hypothetical protein